MKSRKKPSKIDSCMGKTMMILLCLVFSPAMLYLGISSIQDEQKLNTRGALITAEVTEIQSEQENNPEDHHVRYQFNPGGGEKWYAHSDRTGRKNIWCSIPEEHWKAVELTRQVDVLYLPEDPWINRPVYNSSSMFDLWTAVLMGIFPWLILLVKFLDSIGRQKPDNPSS